MVHALCNIQALLTNGLLRMGERADKPEESFTFEYVIILYLESYIYISLVRERREHHIFVTLLHMVPGLEERLMEGGDGDVVSIAEMVGLIISTVMDCIDVRKLQKGVSGARADDTKGLKGPILNWIIPQGQPLNPSLSCNMKVDRGFHHERTGFLLCPTGEDWSDVEFSSHISTLDCSTLI